MVIFLMCSCALLGLAVGSFLNVVIYRVPRKVSIVSPRSACPECHTQKVFRRIRPDKIDPMIKSFSSIVRGLLGGTLYHCYYCRIQFYDSRHTMKVPANQNESSPASYTDDSPPSTY